jgi:prepilin-type N-terminal cleavage/methylation domain-containing protein
MRHWVLVRTARRQVLSVKTEKMGAVLGKKGFTLIELLVVIAIIAI